MGRKEFSLPFATSVLPFHCPQTTAPNEHKMCRLKIFHHALWRGRRGFHFYHDTTPISHSFSSNCRYMVAVVVAAAAVVTEDDAEGGAAGAAANAAAATAEKSYDDTEDDAEGDGAMGGAFRWSTYMLLAVNFGTTPHRLDKSPDLDRSKIRSEKEIESPNSTKSFLIPTTVASRIPVTFKSLAPSPVFNTVIEE
jgi:hypothetical protein